MRTFDIVTPLKAVKFDELSIQEQNLVEIARDATYRSYAPYSHFRVGAAILLENGEIVPGSNQENVAFPSGTCAERTACFFAHSQYPDQAFKAIAIAARGVDELPVVSPIAPCGACRQSLLEYEKLAENNVEVILVGKTKIFIFPSVNSTLPYCFDEF